jgi:DNA-binding NtrC family response regulator
MSKNGQKPSLLIVDDEVNFRESLEMALEDTFTVFLDGSLAGARKDLA